jgi:hypothetical protein
VLWTVLRVALAVTAALAIYVVGASIIAKFKVPPESEPDPADLEPVDARFECVVCGTRVTMTASQRGGELEAPRHCREDMARIT